MLRLCKYFALLKENVTLRKESMEMKAQIYDLKKGNQQLSKKKDLYKRKWQRALEPTPPKKEQDDDEI